MFLAVRKSHSAVERFNCELLIPRVFIAQRRGIFPRLSINTTAGRLDDTQETYNTKLHVCLSASKSQNLPVDPSSFSGTHTEQHEWRGVKRHLQYQVRIICAFLLGTLVTPREQTRAEIRDWGTQSHWFSFTVQSKSRLAVVVLASISAQHVLLKVQHVSSCESFSCSTSTGLIPIDSIITQQAQSEDGT